MFRNYNCFRIRITGLYNHDPDPFYFENFQNLLIKFKELLVSSLLRVFILWFSLFAFNQFAT